MKIKECMSRDVWTIREDTTLRSAAEMMAKHDLGSLPVAKDAKLVGMLTDRDIALRGIGQGCGPDVKAAQVMSKEILYCHADDEIDGVLANMGDQQVRRLVVIDEDRDLVGIVSIGDLAKHAQDQLGTSYVAISEPSDLHSQSLR
ncbi:MAG: CBS domain-containing protein [Sphingomonadaceae bacterium]